MGNGGKLHPTNKQRDITINNTGRRMDNWRHFNVDGHKETNTVNMRKEEYDEIKRKYKNR